MFISVQLKETFLLDYMGLFLRSAISMVSSENQIFYFLSFSPNLTRSLEVLVESETYIFLPFFFFLCVCM